MRRHGLFWLGLAPVLALTGRARPADTTRAGPQAIVFAGPPLRHRVVLRDFSENQKFMVSLARQRVLPADTAGRGGIDVAMFYVRSAVWTDRPMDSIPLALADERGRYFPAVDKHPALLLPRAALTGGGFRPSVVSRAGQQILARHGIPTGPIIAR